MDRVELDEWFETTRKTLESAYIQHDEPWRQSGMSGPEDRWIRLRKPIADCIDRSGTFLDIGCANGYLIEWVLKWTAERGVKIDPYGLDISEKLLELARERLPDYRDHLYLGNAFYWEPPRRFDFAATELVDVPDEYEREYVNRLLKDFLEPGGSLLISNYMELDPNPMRGLLPGCEPTRFLADRLAELGFEAVRFCDGYDPVKDRHVRVAVLRAS